MKKPVYLLLFTLLLFLSSCAGQETGATLTGWEYTDLRLLDPADVSEPAHDLIALYTRHGESDGQIRLDLLEQTNQPDYDLYIVIDSLPGGTRELPLLASSEIEWERLFIIPAQDPILMLDEQFMEVPNASLQVWRDPRLAGIVISYARQSLTPEGFPLVKSQGFSIEVFLTPSDSKEVVQHLTAVRSDSQPPAQAQVLFTFWDAFPAYTPATALRRWRGAHTGPLGGSHGLYHLLSSSQSSGIPLVLLDLTSATSLSALDQMGILNIVREMVMDGDLILPDPIPQIYSSNSATQKAFLSEFIHIQKDALTNFNLPSSQFSYLSSDIPPDSLKTRAVFIKQNTTSTRLEAVNTQRYQNTLLIPIYEIQGMQPKNQTTAEGLSIEVKRALLETALSTIPAKNDAPSLLLLGGSLPESTWGIPNYGRAGFQELKQHPWIRVLNANDLLGLSSQSNRLATGANEKTIGAHTSPEKYEELEQALLSAPDNILRQAAWQAYLALEAPVSPAPPDIPSLRASYLPIVWSLLEAAQWAAAPYDLSSCTDDTDHDAHYECILANQSSYIQIEIKSGAISFAFTRQPDQQGKLQIHQLIAPSSQFISGLSDPIFWQTINGKLSDPDIIAGAFADDQLDYEARLVTPNNLLLYDTQSGAKKSIQLGEHQIRVYYHQQPNMPRTFTQIPIALDPWMRFKTGWADTYQEYQAGGAWGWAIDSSIQIQINANTNFQIKHFNQSRQKLDKAEDPNIDYPQGHFLPYPLAVLQIPYRDRLMIKIKWIETAIIE